MVLVITGVLPATGKSPVTDRWSQSLPGQVPQYCRRLGDAELDPNSGRMAK